MTNRFLAGLFALAFCFIIALPAPAQDPPTTEEKGRPPRMVVISPAPAQAPLTPEKKALKRINFGELIEKVSFEIYDKYFTEAEVKDMIAFYKTPTAQKFIKILPQISAEMFPRIGQLMDPAVTRLVTDLLGDELKRLTGKQN